MTIFVTGDTHNTIDLGKLNNKCFPLQKDLTKSDYVIIAGDFGLVWDDSEHDLYQRKQLNNRNFTILFVDGNHENFDLLEKYPIEDWNGGKVQKIEDSVIRLMRGEVYEIDGQKIFAFGGASSVDKAHRIEGKSWWPQEIPTREEMENGIANLEKHNWEVDFVITHTCPDSFTDRLVRYKILTDNTTERYLEHIYNNLKFKHWFFGHWHADLELEDNITALYRSILRIKEE